MVTYACATCGTSQTVHQYTPVSTHNNFNIYFSQIFDFFFINCIHLLLEFDTFCTDFCIFSLLIAYFLLMKLHLLNAKQISYKEIMNQKINLTKSYRLANNLYYPKNGISNENSSS